MWIAFLLVLLAVIIGVFYENFRISHIQKTYKPVINVTSNKGGIISLEVNGKYCIYNSANRTLKTKVDFESIDTKIDNILIHLNLSNVKELIDLQTISKLK